MSVTTSYLYDLCNKVLSETENGITTEYIYDALGNLTKKTDNTGTTTYVYDALNRLTEVVNSNGTWQRNTYDASGIRATLCENGITTEYMTLNGMVLAGYDKGGERREHYFYGSSILGEELFGVATGTATATDTKETLCTFYLKNSHGDVIGQTDENGTLTKSYAYNAFGTLIHSTALDGLEDTMSRFLYSGEQYDTISGLYYLRARHYDTEAGRFTQEDTYLGDGRNLYAYVHNNPVMYTDSSGHFMQKQFDSNPIPDEEMAALGGVVDLLLLGLARLYSSRRNRTGSIGIPSVGSVLEIPVKSGAGTQSGTVEAPSLDLKQEAEEPKSIDNVGSGWEDTNGWTLDDLPDMTLSNLRDIDNWDADRDKIQERAVDIVAHATGVLEVPEKLLDAEEKSEGVSDGKCETEASNEEESDSETVETPIFTGQSKPWESGATPNSIYEQLNPDGTVKSRAFYDENGRQFYRQDFDHQHFDKNTQQYYQPHEHRYHYNEEDYHILVYGMDHLHQDMIIFLHNKEN